MPEGKKKQTSTSVAAKYKPHDATSEEVIDGATGLLHRLGRNLDALEVHAVGAVDDVASVLRTITVRGAWARPRRSPPTAGVMVAAVSTPAARGNPCAPAVFNELGTGKSLTNQAYDRVLHASATQVTPQGHKDLYTCAPSNGGHAEEFTIVPVPVPVTDPANPPGRFAYTGYFNLVSVRTGEMAKYGLGRTPGGRTRVHQELPGSNLYFY